MARKRSKGSSSREDGASTADHVKAGVRGFAIVVLVGAILFALLDFMEKGKFEASFKAVGDRVAEEGCPIEELPSAIQGSPRVSGDIATDQTVVYRWGLIRSYDMTLTVEGSPERAVVQVQ